MKRHARGATWAQAVDRRAGQAARRSARGAVLLTLGMGAHAFAEPGPSITAIDAAREMGVGINLGNTFDYPVNPTELASAKAHISVYADAGFANVRIPVTWNGLFPTPLIDEAGGLNATDERFISLEGAIDHALDEGLYVIINMHHEKWLKHAFAGPDTDLAELFAAAWTSIATHFADRSHRLMFEVLNEPEGTMGDWVDGAHPFDPAALQLTREINLIGYRAIRAVPGNENRIVLLAPNGMGNQGMISSVYPDALSLPGGGKDSHLMVTLHTYDPWPFAGQDGDHAVYLDQDDPAGALKKDIDQMIGAIAEWAEVMPVGVHWGEYGVGRIDQADRDHDIVRLYYAYLTKQLNQRGWGTSVWDDRGWFAVSRGANADAGREDPWVFGFKDAVMRGARAE